MKNSFLVLVAAIVAAAAGPVLAQDAVPETPRIVVVGRAVLERPPDEARVSIGVTTRGPNAAAAMDETSTSAAKVVAAARAFGIDGRDIRTTQASLQQVFKNVRDPTGTYQQQPDGYEATNSVEVRLRDLSRVGAFLRQGVGEGANRVTGLTFSLSSRAVAEREAGAAAVKDAVAQAQTLAEAAGVKLGRVERIRPVSRVGAPVAPAPMMARFKAAAPDVPVEAGSLEIVSEVEVTWSLATP